LLARVVIPDVAADDWLHCHNGNMSRSIGTLLIPRDIGAGWGHGAESELARHFELRLKQPVALCDSNDLEGSIADRIRQLADSGVDRIVAVPLGRLPIPEQGRIPRVFARARRQWPNLRFHRAVPLTWLEWADWLQRSAIDFVADLAVPGAETCVLIVGVGDASREMNGDLPRLAQLLLESGPFARVSHAFTGGARPATRDALRDLARLGQRHVVVVSWRIGEETPLQRLRGEVLDLAQTHNLNARLLAPALAHPALINLLVSNYCAALADENEIALAEPDRPVSSSNVETPQRRSRSASAGVTPEEAFELTELEARINALLPPEYRGRYETVRPQSMGTASLKYDSEGRVAWGEIWTSFCDLALAGGPPHRGTLLEAVSSEAALAEPAAYEAVVSEIERGIRLTTGLSVVRSRTPGWVGIQCESEEMAVWLMRAIIVENVMVRREGEILYLPAGPRFAVMREIKNVITTVAKTVHYWSAHLAARRASASRGM
jgi:sirohydrochlorin cobaltochelatase